VSKILGGLTKDPIEAHLRSSNYVLVEFYAKWCMPCRFLETILKNISRNIKNVSIVAIDVDKYSDLSKKYNVEGIPSLMLVGKNGIMWRRSGLLPEEYILNELEKMVPEELRRY